MYGYCLAVFHTQAARIWLQWCRFGLYYRRTINTELYRIDQRYGIVVEVIWVRKNFALIKDLQRDVWLNTYVHVLLVDRQELVPVG